MSRLSADDQVRFLLSCVKNANNGKVRHHPLPPDSTDTAQIDFNEVAKECGVVSRGAA